MAVIAVDMTDREPYAKGQPFGNSVWIRPQINCFCRQQGQRAPGLLVMSGEQSRW